MNKKNYLIVILAAVLGAISIASFAPFKYAFIPIASLAIWVVLIERAKTYRQAMAVGFSWGLGFFGVGVQWVYTTVYTIGGMPRVLACLMYALFTIYLSLYSAGIALVMRRLKRWMQCRNIYSPKVLWCFVFPVVWVGAEWLRGEGRLGFNWLTLGYSQAGVTPLAGWARWVGVYGVSFWLVVMAGYWGMLCLEASRGTAGYKQVLKAIGLSLCLMLCGKASLGYEWTKPSGVFSVSLIQGNVPQEKKWSDQWQLDIFERYTRLLSEARGRLIVVPETALPVLKEQLPKRWLSELQSSFYKEQRTVLLGLVDQAQTTSHYYNSIWSYGLYSNQSYHKRHLVPYGEFIPGIQWFTFLERWWIMPLSSFDRGVNDPKPLYVGQDVWLAPSICYEDGFSELFEGRATQATVLLNISNDAWFGNGIAIDQHLQIAQMRSIESAKPMIRSNNTSGTAIVDADGFIRRELKPFTEGILEDNITVRRGITPFMRYGQWTVLLLCGASILVACCCLLWCKPERGSFKKEKDAYEIHMGRRAR